MEDKKQLIDANYLRKYQFSSIDSIYDEGWNDAIEFIMKKAPTVDAVEVVHGRWMPGYPISCSVCGGVAATDYEDANRYEAWITPYCPNCGAKMDK